MAVGSAAAWLRDCLEHLEVDPDRMRTNLELTGGVLLADRVVTALTPVLGRDRAAELLEEASAKAQASRRPLADALREHPEVAQHLTTGELSELLDPAGYLGSAETFIDRALAAHRSSG
jgi:3-carboxy-cis,cis-muconate cycloisomerase